MSHHINTNTPRRDKASLGDQTITTSLLASVKQPLARLFAKITCTDSAEEHLA